MSFILDALKKSEAERQQRTGPTLMEVRVARPRRRYPLWALAVGLLLAVNGVLLAVFLLGRSTSPSAAPGPGATAPTAAAQAPAPTPVPAAAPVAVPVAGVSAAPPALAAAAPSATGLPPTVGGNSVVSAPPDLAGDSGNPADNLPAIAPDRAAPGAAGSAEGFGAVRVQRVNSGDYSNLPSSTEVEGNLPALRLDLHAYSDRVGDRYALINMHRVHEGDVLSEGPTVLAITREGVALEYHGRQFMLRPQQ